MMTDTTQQTVRIRPEIATGSGRRKGWIKHVTSVDTSKSNGYAFGGDFLTPGRETDLPVGAILVRVDPRGSAKNGWKEGHVLRLEADGDLTEITYDGLDWYKDFLTIRDTVIKALDDVQQKSTETSAETVVVTRHPALIDLLVERGIINGSEGVLSHVTSDDVQGWHVVGVLPLALAAEAISVTEVPLSLAPEDRGVELSLERLREIAGEAQTYQVKRV